MPDFLTVEPSDARLPWYEGAAAMVFEGDWMEGVIRADEQDIAKFDFFLPPTGHEADALLSLHRHHHDRRDDRASRRGGRFSELVDQP